MSTTGNTRASTPVPHPVLAATAAIDAALKAVADVNPTFMRTETKAAAMCELAGLEARLVELRLRIMADAADVAIDSAARDVAAWYAHETRTSHAQAKADLKLARDLDRSWTRVAAGMRIGEVSASQAMVIVRSLETLAPHVDLETLQQAEEHLVSQASSFGPKPLAVLGRRVLDVVAPEVADEVEARRLADLESGAARRTTIRLRRLGDGTTRISGILPDHVGTRLAVYLEAHTNPRKHGSVTAALDDAVANTGPVPDAADPVERLTYPHRLGDAFCAFLEGVDPARLPLHGGSATTVMVTIDLESLRAELAAADLLTTAAIDGGLVDGLSATTDRITASEARRLACTADLVPVVLGGKSEVLDHGRARRLFSPAQRRALLLRDRTCRAEGCDIPGTWAEAHHWVPWETGGPTDLDHGVLLCSHHHHRAHDPAHLAERLPNGDVRFARRR